MYPRFRSNATICLLLFLLVSSFSVGQLDSNMTFEAPLFSRKVKRDPTLLVESLIAGKTSDLEKFEAIFVWVACNIKYDYRRYFSGKGSSVVTDINSVLRRKRALCFQYADLMNALCSRADLHSVTVTGYVKDWLFDINDSLYFDNHAWNAVKLDDRWYLYDVTWSAGGFEYEMTRFSKRVVNWQKTIQAKKKKLKKQVIVIYHKGNEFCEIPKHKEKKIRMVLKLPFFWRVIDEVLSWKRLRMKIVHGKLKNTQFFLTDPYLFAQTHFPNVPYWSLTDEIANVNEFANDSTYYDLNKEDYLIQKREGQMCLKCDDFFALDFVDQEKAIIQQSLANNPRNGLVPSTSYFKIAEFFFKEAELAVDSLEKVQGYDSTLFYLNLGKNELKRCGPQNKAYFKFHLAKESEKVKQLKIANKKHTEVNIINVANLRKRAKKIKTFNTKIKTNQRLYLRTHRTLMRFRPRHPSSKVMKPEKVAILEERVELNEQKMDSLNEQIAIIESELLVRLTTLSDRVWEHVDLIYPENRLFNTCSSNRIFQGLDDRDKTIAELQKKINQYEESLTNSVTSQLLLPTDTLYMRFIELNKLIKLRNRNQSKGLKLYAELYVGNVIQRDSLEAARSRFSQLIKVDYCYFFKHQLPIKDFAWGYKLFNKNHYGLFWSIKWDNKAELIRHKAFVKGITLTKRRATDVINHNKAYLAKAKSSTLEAKKKYIKERRAANKKLLAED